ncbi:hypothetical protein M427DRAFT_159118 [Gonapodya prolifera JEL478]|uniref:PCI domain-containing protein n=1 Tax=Gonapodya prolifera (strain JEL478) TaxID=1344416 RepID=A0A139A161_GONPJ|nr:hypothetical protein M427DRAFT_159118 [Gonapodya prolifera JEL478]|eukprot:KXS10482.1 hypothetical protein M427DRAFT_159118 [Gonapodya prolifera JEL478]
MKQSITSYTRNVTEAISSQDGTKLASLLSHRDRHATNVLDDINRALPSALSRLIGRELDEPWDDVVLSHFNVVLSLQGGGGSGKLKAKDVAEASKHQNALVQNFSRVFAQSTRWSLPVMYCVSRELVALAARADEELTKADKEPKYLEESYRTLTKIFSLCANDRSSLNLSRKWGTYYITNLLFKICYRLGKQNLVLTFTKVLRSGDFPQLERFPASHRIEFWYYSGMLAFLDEQYDTAEQRLGDSFNHCLRTAKHNKSLILTYLIPLRMLRGKLPTSALFKKYPTVKPLYEDITVALRKGDVKTFDRLMEEKEEILVQRQVFLVVEKLRALCLRNLLKRIHLISSTVSGTRLAIEPIQTALVWLDCNSGAREVECVVANLIDKGYIRGYISRERQIIVLSKENAFPPVSSVSVS